jgi:prepilin-type N-terminal cleavage/methylation domain-containing protein
MKRTKNKKEIRPRSVKVRYRGFSLIEMLISMFIMVTIITAVTAVFAKSYLTRKSAREYQANLEEARTAIEAIAKNMRMSSEAVSADGETLTMLNNSQTKCVRYRFDGVDLKLYQSFYPYNSGDDCAAGDYETNEGEVISRSVEGGFVIIPTDRTGSPKSIGRGTVWIRMGTQTLQTSVSFRDYEDIIY